MPSAMDLCLSASFGTCNFTRLLPSRTHIPLVKSRSATVHRIVLCTATSETSSHTVVRRSGNYQPPIWQDDFIQSLKSEYAGESYSRRIDKLKEEVKMMIHEAVDSLERLELIDTLQRLGLSYHFEQEIRRMLEDIYTTKYGGMMRSQEDLHATALEFRLLRQHGYNVPQEIFMSFKNEKGTFKACLCNDIKGMLSLYEASFLSIEGETILEEARDFTTKQLNEYVKQSKDQRLIVMVNHALELPLRWRMLRLEVRWFIDVYRSREDANPILLELAGLDFNLVQAAYQEDLKDVSRWWKSTGLGEKLSFARDRLLISFLWTVGVTFEPQFGHCRRTSAKVNALITVIDDVYDVYGTLDELELFTNVVERWDTKAMDQLPYYMKICFLSLHNTINEIGFDVLKDQGIDIIPYLRKAWADLCKAYLLEAKWYHTGYAPSFEEYLENALFSIAAPVILLHAYIFVANPVTKEALDYLEEFHDIIRWSSTLLRLADDLGTSKDELERGDTFKSIQCYMIETGASEEDAREYVKSLISATWKKINKEKITGSPLAQTFVESAANLGRMAQCIYLYGDGHAGQGRETKDRISSLFVNPTPLR